LVHAETHSDYSIKYVITTSRSVTIDQTERGSFVSIHDTKQTSREEPMPKKLLPMHPGRVLREEFLVPLKLSAGALARKMGVPRTRVERIASEDVSITADTALRLGKALGTSPHLWLNLQNDYDLQMARRDIGKIIEKIKPVKAHEAA